MSGLSDAQDSEVGQNGQEGSPPPKESGRKLEPCKEGGKKEEGDDDEEEEVADFNPFLIAEPASEASSSLSFEDEGSVDSSQRRPLRCSEHPRSDAEMRQMDETGNCGTVSGSKRGKVFHTRHIQEGHGEKNIALGKLDKKHQSNIATEQGEGFVSPEGSRKGNASSDETEAADE